MPITTHTDSRHAAGPWPATGLESSPGCPACGHSVRTAWFQDLSDRLYGIAPGQWTFNRCAGCGSAYLDPRPTRATIAHAYRNYYTHAPAPDLSPSVGRGTGVRRALRHGYLNRRFGLSLDGASSLGPLLVPLVPGLAARHRRWGRLALPHDHASLLDVGAGSGAAVAHFRRLGWDAMGLDPDPAAVAAAQSREVPVLQGDITTLEGAARFDAITMSHSIEHLHEPRPALATTFRLLSPGGVLEIATPNARSLGLRMYAQDWLGLDPPRHLVLFTPRALKLVLRDAGFEAIAFHHAYRSPEWYFRASEALSRGLPWTEDVSPGPRERMVLLFSKCCSGRLPWFGEELVVTAVKPARSYR